MLAADKEQGNMREDREDEKLLRIFIKVPKSHTEEMIQKYFKVKSGIQFFRIEKNDNNINIVEFFESLNPKQKKNKTKINLGYFSNGVT